MRAFTPTKLAFMLENLRGELEAGREGRNELYDNENLMKAYDCAVYDIHYNDARSHLTEEALEALTARRDVFREEILLRVRTGLGAGMS